MKWKKWMKSYFSGFHQVSPVSWSFTNFSIFRFHQFHSFQQLHEVSWSFMFWASVKGISGIYLTWSAPKSMFCLGQFEWESWILGHTFVLRLLPLVFLETWHVTKEDFAKARDGTSLWVTCSAKVTTCHGYSSGPPSGKGKKPEGKKETGLFFQLCNQFFLHKFFYSSWDTLIWWGKGLGCIRADGDTKARVLWAMLFLFRVEMWKLKLRWRESPSWSFEVRWNVRVSLFPNFHSTDDCDPLCKRKAESRQRIVKSWEFSHDFDDLQERNQHFLSEFPWPITKILFFVTIFRWSASFDWSWWVLSWMHWKVWFVLIKGSVENWAVKGDVDGAKEERKKKGRAIHNVKDGCGTCETWRRNGRDSIRGIFLSSPFISLGLIRHCLLQSLCGAIFPTKHFWADSSWIPKEMNMQVYFNLWIQKPEGKFQRGNRISQSLGPLGLLNKFFRGFPPWIDGRSDGALAQSDQIAPKFHRWHSSWRGRYHSRPWQVARALGDKLGFLVTTCCRNFWSELGSLTERD